MNLRNRRYPLRGSKYPLRGSRKSLPATEYSTISMLTTRSSVSPCTLTTHPTGCPFSPRVPVTSSSGICRTDCNSTLTSREHWSSALRTSCAPLLLPYRQPICSWRRSAGGWWNEGARCRAWPPPNIPEARHDRSTILQLPLSGHPPHKSSRLLSRELALTLACSLILTRMDYCNSMLYGAPSSSIQILQRAQNNAARIVLQAPRRSHARPLLRDLHWLPIQHRIEYNVAVLTFKSCSSATAPTYLESSYQGSRQWTDTSLL